MSLLDRSSRVSMARLIPEEATAMSDTEPPRLKTVPAASENGRYLALVAEHGRCTCKDGALCSEQNADDNPGLMFCHLCQRLDLEWPCPTLDDDADYPDPDVVFIAPAGESQR